MKHLFILYMRDKDGATAIEYGLIAAIISGVIIAGGLSLGNAVNSALDGAAQHLKNSQ